MTLKINEELRLYIDPLTANEYAALEASLQQEGCRDALVLWNDLLVDGHNRYAICQQHGIEFRTVQNSSFTSIDDVHLWMIDNHLGRRSVSDFQRGVLALRKKEILSARIREQPAAAPAAPEAGTPPPRPAVTREDLARAARLSSNTIGQIEKIQQAASPELMRAVRNGTISINAAAAVATLSQSEQQAAVAGGRKELQQAARQVREQKSAQCAVMRPVVVDEQDELGRLRAEIVRLKEENRALQDKIAVLGAERAAGNSG